MTTCNPASRLNWQLHFGESPKWSDSVKFILVDVEPSQRDADKAALVLQGDAGRVAEQLLERTRNLSIQQWQKEIQEKVTDAKNASNVLECIQKPSLV